MLEQPIPLKRQAMLLDPGVARFHQRLVRLAPAAAYCLAQRLLAYRLNIDPRSRAMSTVDYLAGNVTGTRGGVAKAMMLG